MKHDFGLYAQGEHPNFTQKDATYDHEELLPWSEPEQCIVILSVTISPSQTPNSSTAASRCEATALTTASLCNPFNQVLLKKSKTNKSDLMGEIQKVELFPLKGIDDKAIMRIKVTMMGI